MKTKEIIKKLNKANSWRRGLKWAMPDPTEFWIAIDYAVERLKQYEQMINSMKWNMDSMQQTKEALLKKLNNEDEILNSACSELQFANLQKDFYKSILDEVEVLAKRQVKHNLIQKVIENSKQRAILDISIHYDVRCGIDNNNLSSQK